MNSATDDGAELLAAIGDEWVGLGQCTELADRKKAEWAVRSALESAGCETHSMLFIWVQSPWRECSRPRPSDSPSRNR